VAHAERPRELVRREEAEADADGVDVERALAPGHRPAPRVELRDDGPLDALRPFGPHDGVAEQHRDACATERREVVEAVAHQPGRGERHARDRSASPDASGRALAQRDDGRAGACQLGGHLHVQRAVAGHQHAPTRQHLVRAHERLHGAGRHEPRQRPPGQRHAPLVRPRREHETAGPQQERASLRDREQLVRRRRAPDLDAALQGRTRPLQASDQVAPAPVLGVQLRLVDVEGVGGLLEVLPAELRPLVDEDDFRARLGGSRGRGETAGTAADDEDVRVERDRREPGGARVAGFLQLTVGLHRHPVAHRRHARARRHAVRDDDAVVAHAHPAEHAARVAGVGAAAQELAGVDERGGEAVSLPALDPPAAEENRRSRVARP
jgi:hypothetical protein